MAQPFDWRSHIPATHWEAYERAGLGGVVPLGARPAVLVIDVQYRTLGHTPLPLAESQETYYPSSCGDWGWRALDRIGHLLTRARALDVPVIFPHIPADSESQRQALARKAPGLVGTPDAAYGFPSAATPQGDELALPKVHASSFAGTSLVSHLIALGVDSLILTGCTTSGCIRATAIDASFFNFPVTVVDDAVYDRSELSHSVNLFDMQAKYTNVTSTDEVVADLEEMTAGRQA